MEFREAPDSMYEIRPSDLNQAYLRVVLVAAVLAWTVYNALPLSIEVLPSKLHFRFTIGFLVIAILIVAWTKYFLTSPDTKPILFLVTRVLGVLTDVGAASFYTAVSGDAGIILYPVFLTISIGYGYRFGIGYLYFSLICCAFMFGIAAHSNVSISGNRSLIWAYYLGIALVPLYAASLLNRHQIVLQRIQEVNSARARFIANMSHELRTPLHAIISVSDLLIEESLSKSSRRESSAHKLRMIGESAHHLLDLVNRVLDIASADAVGIGRPVSQSVNLPNIIGSSFCILRPSADSRRIGFYWFYDLALPDYVLSHNEYLQEILINTIGNAIKYTPEGYVEVNIEPKNYGGASVISISIIDTGIGISTKLLPTIFEPFTLGDDTAARNFQGTGLGLTITKQYIENLGGTIDFDSTEGVGTECRIKLPCTPVAVTDPIIRNDSNKYDCILVTPRTIGCDEEKQFEESGWQCHVVQYKGIDSDLLRKSKAIFVDASYGTLLDVVLDSLPEICRDKVVSQYVKSSADQPSKRRGFNTLVYGDRPLQLAKVRRIADSFLGKRNDNELGRSAFSSRGITDVLVADDNATNLITAKLALESCGLNVSIAENGEQALAQLDENSFNLAFVDLHMPQMSGLEVIKIYQFLKSETTTPIVILTADVTPQARQEAMEAGAAAVLTKPLGVQALREAVLNYSQLGEISNSGLAVTIGKEPETISTELLDKSVIDEFISLKIPMSDLFDVINSFSEDAGRLLQKIKSSMADGDMEEIRHDLHALKGVCYSVGANHLLNVVVRDLDVSGDSPFFKRPAICAKWESALVETVAALKEYVTQREDEYHSRI